MNLQDRCEYILSAFTGLRLVSIANYMHLFSRNRLFSPSLSSIALCCDEIQTMLIKPKLQKNYLNVLTQCQRFSLRFVTSGASARSSYPLTRYPSLAKKDYPLSVCVFPHVHERANGVKCKKNTDTARIVNLSQYRHFVRFERKHVL